MIRHVEYTRARLAQTSDRLRQLVYPAARPVDKLLVAGPVDRISWADAQQLECRPVELGERFGPLWATFWFRLRATPPVEWKGRRVDLLFASGSEAALWDDGRVVQGLNTVGGGERPDAILTESAEPGSPLDRYVELACNGLFGATSSPAARAAANGATDER